MQIVQVTTTVRPDIVDGSWVKYSIYTSINRDFDNCPKSAMKTFTKFGDAFIPLRFWLMGGTTCMGRTTCEVRLVGYFPAYLSSDVLRDKAKYALANYLEEIREEKLDKLANAEESRPNLGLMSDGSARIVRTVLEMEYRVANEILAGVRKAYPELFLEE